MQNSRITYEGTQHGATLSDIEYVDKLVNAYLIDLVRTSDTTCPAD